MNAIKQALDKLRAPDDLEEQLNINGFTHLPVTVQHGLAAGRLPMHHRDPFDRLLVAQARIENLTLVMADRAIQQYETSTLTVR